MIGMKDQWFGGEVEFTCITREKAAKVNSTPIVRQYGILLTNGVLFYAKRESK